MSPSESHDEFFELCALSTTELLSDEERRRLEQHLRICPSCREIHAQYEALVEAGIPAAVAGVEAPSPAPFAVDAWLNEAEEALFARLDREGLQVDPDGHNRNLPDPLDTSSAGLRGFPREPGREIDEGLWRGMWWQFAAFILLVLALGVSVYRAGLRRGAEQAAAAAPPLHPEPTPGPRISNDADERAQAASEPASLRAEKAAVTALRAQLSIKAAEIARLEEAKAALEQNLALSQSSQQELQRNSDALNRQLAGDEADLAVLRQRLSAAGQQDSEDALLVTTLRQQIGDLKTSIDGRDQEIAREQDLLDHDRDIRELMGSRNLYIAEVYDVARNGRTKKPFGRVFYTKDRSLIFYAYDLDQQPGVRDSSTFQAWGSRGPDRADAVSLGIFYQDNASGKRWMLKADNPKVLSGIDAIFVTVEPHGGSSHPSGKPLLYAYLHIGANHP